MQIQTSVERPKKGKGKGPEAKKKMDKAAARTLETLPHPVYTDLSDVGELRKAKRAVVEIDDRESELWKWAKQFEKESEISITLALFAAAVSLPDEKRDDSTRKLIGPFEENGLTAEYIALQGLAMRLLTEADIRDDLHSNRFIFAQLPEIMVAISN